MECNTVVGGRVYPGIHGNSKGFSVGRYNIPLDKKHPPECDASYMYYDGRVLTIYPRDKEKRSFITFSAADQDRGVILLIKQFVTILGSYTAHMENSGESLVTLYEGASVVFNREQGVLYVHKGKLVQLHYWEWKQLQALKGAKNVLPPHACCKVRAETLFLWGIGDNQKLGIPLTKRESQLGKFSVFTAASKTLMVVDENFERTNTAYLQYASPVIMGDYVGLQEAKGVDEVHHGLIVVNYGKTVNVLKGLDVKELLSGRYVQDGRFLSVYSVLFTGTLIITMEGGMVRLLKFYLPGVVHSCSVGEMREGIKNTRFLHSSLQKLLPTIPSGEAIMGVFLGENASYLKDIPVYVCTNNSVQIGTNKNGKFKPMLGAEVLEYPAYCVLVPAPVLETTYTGKLKFIIRPGGELASDFTLRQDDCGVDLSHDGLEYAPPHITEAQMVAITKLREDKKPLVDKTFNSSLEELKNKFGKGV